MLEKLSYSNVGNNTFCNQALKELGQLIIHIICFILDYTWIYITSLL